MVKKAVIYARYSSDSQTEQSIEGQLRVCKEYAKNNDILIVDTYIDRAMTGTNDMRPDFQRMIKDSAKQQWEIVLVYKLDRFSRDKYETTIHKHTLKENGVKLVSAMENIPDSPEGIILESLLEGMNQYYSEECFYGHYLFILRFIRLSSTFVAQRKAEVNGKICYLKFEYILRVELDLKIADLVMRKKMRNHFLFTQQLFLFR